MPADPRTHIFHVVNSLRIGGLEQVVVNLVNGLDSDRYRHSICCIDKTGPMLERLRVPVTIHDIGKGSAPDRLLPFKIAAIIRRDRPDVVHTRNWSAIDGVLGARLAGVRAVVHDEHGRGADDPQGTNWKRNAIRRLLRGSISQFVAISEELAHWLRGEIGVPESKVVTIINGVDTTRFRPATDRAALRIGSRLPMKASSFTVGFVGRLDPVKDLPTLLLAFSKVCELAPPNREPHLLMVGDGPLQDVLRGRAAELGLTGRVTFTGSRDDIPSLMRSTDVFCLSSISEGMPMTVLEAMATGLPVVGTMVGGMAEVVTDGETGALVPVADPQRLAEALLRYCWDKKLAVLHGNAGLRKVRKEFSLESMVSNYDSLYGALVDRYKI